jgi:CO/xanthine dehydrogenase FAD-binding subunit
LRQPPKNARLVTEVEIPLQADLSFKKVARTPDDLPVLSLALARWPSGRVRIALGGFGSAPILALDAPESGGVEEAVRDALSNAEDAWGTAAYRQDIGVKLVRRMLKELE